MLHLPNLITAPPGGWRYRIQALAPTAPSLVHVGPCTTLPQLEAEVSARCRANGLPVPLRDEIIDQLCGTLPPGSCLDEHETPNDYGMANASSPTGTRVGWRAYVQGTRTLVNWWMNGRRRVARDEIIRRSFICNECPKNLPIEGCPKCMAKEAHELVNAVVADQSLPTDALLRACDVCKCSLTAKVRMPVDDASKYMSSEQRDALWSGCWLRPENAPSLPPA